MSTEKGHPSRGISVYSYQMLLGKTMTLDDVFLEMYDTGATCFELLTSYIEGYPNPTTQWIDHYWGLCEKYKLRPSELGHWAEGHLHRGPGSSVDEMVEQLKRDFRLANLLGFTSLRTKITCTNRICDPEPGWQDYIEKALPWAEKYNVRMQNEVHLPTTLHTPHIRDEYLEFIHRTGTKHFGFNIDFGTFQFRQAEGMPERMMHFDFKDVTKPEEIVEFLPYSWACHTKFVTMNENFEETTIPYAEVIKLMVDNGWSGDLLSEYEGPARYGSEKDAKRFGNALIEVPDQVRRHQIMMRNILGY